MGDKIYMFDDGSVASKLLQHEYKDQYDIKSIKVNKSDDLVQQFTKVNNSDGIKIFLPFYVEQLVADNEKLRRQIYQVESLGFKNLIVLPFEGRDEKTINQRAEKAGLTGEVLKGVKENEKNKPYYSIRTNRNVQDV